MSHWNCPICSSLATKSTIALLHIQQSDLIKQNESHIRNFFLSSHMSNSLHGKTIRYKRNCMYDIGCHGVTRNPFLDIQLILFDLVTTFIVFYGSFRTLLTVCSDNAIRIPLDPLVLHLAIIANLCNHLLTGENMVQMMYRQNLESLLLKQILLFQWDSGSFIGTKCMQHLRFYSTHQDSYGPTTWDSSRIPPWVLESGVSAPTVQLQSTYAVTLLCSNPRFKQLCTMKVQQMYYVTTSGVQFTKNLKMNIHKCRKTIIVIMKFLL